MLPKKRVEKGKIIVDLQKQNSELMLLLRQSPLKTTLRFQKDFPTPFEKWLWKIKLHLLRKSLNPKGCFQSVGLPRRRTATWLLLCKAAEQCCCLGAWDKGQAVTKTEGTLREDCEIELSAAPFLGCNFLEVSVLGVRGSVNCDLLQIIPAWLAADHLGAPPIKRIWRKKSPLRTDRSWLSFIT